MSVWDDLIAESRRLEELANKIQGNPGLPTDEINNFVEDYMHWYGECLSVLPEDLQHAFSSKYIEDWSGTTIETFIKSPLERNEDYKLQILRGHFLERAPSPWEHPFEDCFQPNILAQRQLLIQASKRRSKTPSISDDVENIERLARRFNLIVRELSRQRYADRTPLTIDDEFDVQYLFQALLRIHFDDIRPEEPVPSVGGKSSRIDFLLKREQIIVEIKMTRDTLKSREVSNELIIDMARYTGHPDFKTFIAIVYDPKKYIANPTGIEDDLNKLNKEMLVKVIILQG